MKNKEKYAKEIIDIALSEERLTVNDKSFPCRCCDILCEDCLFHSDTLLCYRSDKIEKWAEEEYHEPILDEVEKKYLSAVIKPFRDDIKFIIKMLQSSTNLEYIGISTSKGVMLFPSFKIGTMYIGMQRFKEYTLEELGL